MRSDSVVGTVQAAASGVARPLKRPLQQRSRFTVTAIYDALVRIWVRDGPSAVTMRNIAVESGFAIGTLYEYFPNVDALLSGYIRHVCDGLLSRLDAELRRTEGAWPDRLRRFVGACCAPDPSGLFDRRLLQLESSLARDDDHARFFAKLERRWVTLFDSWDGPKPPPDKIAVLALSVWGSRRYKDLLGKRAELDGWIDQLCRNCEAALRD